MVGGLDDQQTSKLQINLFAKLLENDPRAYIIGCEAIVPHRTKETTMNSNTIKIGDIITINDHDFYQIMSISPKGKSVKYALLDQNEKDQWSIDCEGNAITRTGEFLDSDRQDVVDDETLEVYVKATK